MARISTYGPDQSLHLKDKVLGSSYIRTVNSVDEFETQNFTLEELKGFLDGELSVSTLRLKPNGGLVTEVITGVTYLAVDLSATNITGALANSDLANSSITINGTAISLGGSVTTPDTNTQLSTEEVQDIVGAMVSGNTETNIAVTYNDTDGKLNFVSTDTNTDTQLSTEQVQDIVGAMFSGNTETRISAVYEDSDGTIDLTVDDMTANTQLTTEEVQDIVGAMVSGNTENNISVTYDDSSGKLNFDSTDTDTNTQLTTEQVRAKFTEGTNITINNGEISATDTNTQLSTEQVQDIVGGMVSSNTETNISVTYDDTNGKLDFVSTDTNTDTNNYVTGASVSGTTSKTLTLTRQGLSDVTASWTDIDTVYTLPAATNSALGGIKIGYTENAKNYPVELDSDKAYVNVPWTDTVYTLPVASSSLGGIKIGYTDNGKNYALELDGDNEAYVNVPWTDTVYTLPTAAANTLGGVKVGSNLTIDGNGVLNVGAIALTTVQTAANESAHLALTTQEGDVVVRTDQNKSYVKNSGTAGNMNDFTELLTPTDAVLSVTTSDGTYINLTPNSATTGAITVAADLSAVDGTSDTTDRFLTKDNKWAVPSYTTETYTQHDNISAASSVDNSGRTYIQDITLDSNGHVTGITSATETVVNTDTNTNQLTEWTLRDDDNDDVTIDHNTFVKFEAATGALNTNITGAGTTGDPYVVTITSPDSTIANTFRTVQADGSSIGATETLNLIGGTNVTLSENNGAITITSTDTDTVYTHPSHDGDDINIDTTALTGATVISDLDFNITTDTLGHVTDANGTVATRDLTLADLGYTGDTAANNYTLPAATSTVRGGVELFSDTVQSTSANSVTSTASRTYGVQVNSNGQMVVNVPWSDTDTDTNTNILSGGTITGDVTVNGDMTFEDGHKLELGTGADLDLYHTSGHSYIDNNTGNLYIRCNPSGEIHLRPKESENGVIIRDDGKTELYFDDAKKLETVTGGVNVTGTLTASADVVAYSDERLKTDIKTLDGSKVYDMRGVSFIKDNKQSSGVIAQELEEIAPELVNNDGEYKSVAYGNITGYLIEAIKDLKKEIEECKKQKCNCNASSR